jgi:hypothetical protein
MSKGGLFDVLRILKTCKRPEEAQLLKKDWNQFGLKTLNLELLNLFDELRADLEPRRKALRLVAKALAARAGIHRTYLGSVERSVYPVSALYLPR